MNIKLIAVAAITGFAAIGAQAFQGEQNPLPPQPFVSTMSRADVQAQAYSAVPITNGGTGTIARTDMADRSAVRAGALSITAAGAQTYGDGDLTVQTRVR
ncbi:DUF4148 domain-containing protein [Variovorax sp. RTB1]|jgi:hypothetical protein|uniref:DUF4148 domain-containing protein n=1 Tax=Variovorax sp. RTB1 TaxID=3048631 RepID=UPI002B232467|nr:DUF4148 domain-containing protein [Variovorax sp. RTB1]MEB0114398.1 DUF4148 domain-containing protein [Variovorax sp. RTB1]